MNKNFIKENKLLLAFFLLLLTITIVSGYQIYIKNVIFEYSETVIDDKNTGNDEGAKDVIGGEVVKEVVDDVRSKNVEKILDDKIVVNTLTTESTTSYKNEINDVKQLQVTLSVEDTSKHSAAIPEGSNIYKLMENLKNETNLDFKSKYYGKSLGEFITEINGIENDFRKGLYWVYYINDEKAQIGVSQYILKNNDIITWKYEKDEL